MDGIRSSFKAIADNIRALYHYKTTYYPYELADALKIPPNMVINPNPDADTIYFNERGEVFYDESADTVLARDKAPTAYTNGITLTSLYDLESVKTRVEKEGFYTIGLSNTNNRGMEIDFNLPASIKTVHLGLGESVRGGSAGLTINWGDNTATSTVAPTGTDEITYASHTYSSPGAYTIKVTTSSIGTALYLGSTDGLSPLLRASLDTTSDAIAMNKLLLGSIYRVVIGAYYSGSGGGTNKLGNYAFAGCIGMESLTLNGWWSIDSVSKVFENCYTLRALTICTYLFKPKSDIFKGCYSLAYLWIGNRDKTMNNYSGNLPAGLFDDLYSLRRLDIVNPFTSVEASSLSACKNLRFVYLTSLRSCANYALKDMSMLRRVALPTMLKTIPQGLLMGCIGLDFVNIPKDTTDIMGEAFKGCTNLQTVSFAEHTSVPTLADTSAFMTLGKSVGCRILVPAELYDAWINSSNWSEIADYIDKCE